MCIWEIDFDVEKYMWCIFKKTKNMDFSQFSDLFYDTETIAEKLPPKIVFHNKDKDNNPIADIMMCTGTYNGIVFLSSKIVTLSPKIKPSVSAKV